MIHCIQKIAYLVLLSLSTADLASMESKSLMELTNGEPISLKEQCIKKISDNKLLLPAHVKTLPINIVQHIVAKQLINAQIIVEEKPIAICKGHTDKVIKLFEIETEVGKHVVSTSYDKTIRIWDLNGKELAVLRGHGSFASQVHALNTEDGRYLVSSSPDETIRIWSLDGKEQGVCLGREHWLHPLATKKTAKGWRIFSGYWGFGPIQTWDLKGTYLGKTETGLSLEDSGRRELSEYMVLEEENGNFYFKLCLEDNTLKIHNHENEYLAQCKGSVDQVYPACMIKVKESWRALAAAKDNTIMIWDACDIFAQLKTINHGQAQTMLDILNNGKDKKDQYTAIKKVVSQLL